MSIIQPPPERRESPSFAPNNPFASNNPFRNRVSAASTDLPSPSVRQSTNPFLDVFDDDILGVNDSDADKTANLKPPSAGIKSQTNAAGGNDPADLLSLLSFDPVDNSNTRNKSPATGGRSLPPPLDPSRPKRPLAPPSQHHHSRSGEAKDMRKNYSSRGPGGGLGGSERGSGNPGMRQRSNSESSVRDNKDMGRDRDRRNDRRPNDSQSRSKDGSGERRSKETGGKSSGSSSSRRRKGSPLDVIDKLDVTGVYGAAFFHHDGPFDACNPHRNKNKVKAPMMAFPEGSKNNALTGFDTDRSSRNHSNYYGNRDPEAYLDFSMPAGRRGSAASNDYGLPPGKDEFVKPSSKRTHSFDPINRPPVHGDESLGLGTSTFLEGAPAAKSAIEKAAAEEEQQRPKTSGGQNGPLGGGMGGLQRKKSLVQKIRSYSSTRPNNAGLDGPLPVPDRRQKPQSPTEGKSPIPPFSPASPPPVNRATKANVISQDAYRDDYDAAWETKGESINTAGVLSSPKKHHPGMERADSDSRVIGVASNSGGAEGGGGILKRVKSLSKGKKQRDAS